MHAEHCSTTEPQPKAVVFNVSMKSVVQLFYESP
jgi:hypothetical protein